MEKQIYKKYQIVFDVLNNKESLNDLNDEIIKIKNQEIDVLEEEKNKKIEEIKNNDKLTKDSKNKKIKKEEETFKKRLGGITKYINDLNKKTEESHNFGFKTISLNTIEGLLLRLMGGEKKIEILKEDSFYSSILNSFKELKYSYKTNPFETTSHKLISNHESLTLLENTKDFCGVEKNIDFWIFNDKSEIFNFFNSYFIFLENFSKEKNEIEQSILKNMLNFIFNYNFEKNNINDIFNEIENYNKEQGNKSLKKSLVIDLLVKFSEELNWINKLNDEEKKENSINFNSFYQKLSKEMAIFNINLENLEEKLNINNLPAFLFIQILRIKFIEDKKIDESVLFENYINTGAKTFSIKGITPRSGNITYARFFGPERIIKTRRSKPYQIFQSSGELTINFKLTEEEFVFIKKLLKLYNIKTTNFGKDGIAKLKNFKINEG